MRRKLLLFLDRTLFRIAYRLVLLAVRLRRRPRPVEPVKPPDDARLLVIRPGGLGDAIMCAPFLRELRRSFPRGRVTVVCVAKNRAALALLPWIDELVVLDAPLRLPRNLLGLRRARFHVVFDLEAFRRTSSLVALLTGCPVRIGFDTNDRRRLYTHLVRYAHDHRFESANHCLQLAVLGIRVPGERTADLSFPLSEAARRQARETLTGLGVDPDRTPCLAVAPGVLKPHHRWRMEEFARLTAMLRAEQPEATILLMGSRGDRRDADELLLHAESHEGVVDLVGATDFETAIALFAHCRLLVACDGGMVYMAAAAGCPTVSLWGPGVMERYKPPGPDHVGVRKDYPCIPCVTWDRLGEFPPCPYGRRCYMDLTAEEVLAALPAGAD